VAVVSSSFATALLEGGEPLGRRFATAPDGDMIEVVGVVETGKYYNLTDQSPKAYWTPLGGGYRPSVSLMARTRANPAESVIPSIRRAARELDPAVALFSVGTMQDQLAWALFPSRIAAIALGGFGILTLVLAATGIYGVMAYAVSRRTREIGIRMAIGATQAQVLAAVFGHAAVLLGVGLLFGLGLALGAGRLLERTFYDVKPSDPASFAIVLALMLVVGVAATFLPSQRAACVQPTQALRQE